jgi:hypothetical protein
VVAALDGDIHATVRDVRLDRDVYSQQEERDVEDCLEVVFERVQAETLPEA